MKNCYRLFFIFLLVAQDSICTHQSLWYRGNRKENALSVTDQLEHGSERCPKNLDWKITYDEDGNKVPPKDPYFDTAFLRNIPKVEEQLKEDGFKTVFFKTMDKLKLRGYFLNRGEKAAGTIICSAGFYPGDLCGMTTYFKLFPEEYNILFYNARGHRGSEGRLFLSLGNYGRNDYKDVLGAIDYANTRSNGSNIFLHGVCAGAYHNLRAAMQDHKNVKNVRGIIADSAWCSVYDVCPQTPKPYFHHNILVPAAAQLFGIKKRTDQFAALADNYFLRALSSFVACAIRVLFSPIECWAYYHRGETTITHNDLQKLNIPVLYIHDKGDHLAPFESSQWMFDKTTEAFFWKVGGSSHGNHGLVQGDLYQAIVAAFINFATKAKTA